MGFRQSVIVFSVVTLRMSLNERKRARVLQYVCYNHVYCPTDKSSINIYMLGVLIYICCEYEYIYVGSFEYIYVVSINMYML